MTFPSDEDLILFYYGEGERAGEIEALLAESPQLAARYEELRRVLDAVGDALPVPPRPAEYGAELWRRLEPRLPVSSLRGPFAWRSWPHRLRELFAAPAGWRGLGRLAAAAALLLAVGFLVGRAFPPAAETPRVVAGLPAAGRDQILLTTLARHLERSERLLVEVANAEPPRSEETIEMVAERRWAEDLLAANRLYRQSARQGGRPRLAALLDELEPLLLELAHAPDTLPAADLAALRERIEERALLFKMRVVSQRLERLERGAGPAPAGVTGSSTL